MKKDRESEKEKNDESQPRMGSKKKRENFRVLRQKAFLTQFWNVPRILAVL